MDTLFLSVCEIAFSCHFFSPSSHHSVEIHQKHPENHKVHENGRRCQVCSC